MSKSENPHEDDTPTLGEVTRRLYSEGIISKPADLEQTFERGRDTLASIHATNGNHAIDDTEPRRKTVA